MLNFVVHVYVMRLKHRTHKYNQTPIHHFLAVIDYAHILQLYVYLT
jgi:hypothetical protein